MSEFRACDFNYMTLCLGMIWMKLEVARLQQQPPSLSQLLVQAILAIIRFQFVVFRDHPAPK